MMRRLGLGKNNHLTYASLALNPRYVYFTTKTCGKTRMAALALLVNHYTSEFLTWILPSLNVNTSLVQKLPKWIETNDIRPELKLTKQCTINDYKIKTSSEISPTIQTNINQKKLKTFAAK